MNFPLFVYKVNTVYTRFITIFVLIVSGRLLFSAIESKSKKIPNHPNSTNPKPNTKKPKTKTTTKKETKKKSLNNPNKTGNFYTNNDSINSENNFSNNEKLDSGTSEESPYLGNRDSSSGGEETRLDSNPHQHSITVTGYSDVVYSGVFFENEYECDTWASNYWGPN